MNTDGDIECICDVGFSSPDCLACSTRSYSVHDRDLHREKPKPTMHLVDLVLHYEKLRKEQNHDN